MNPTGAISNLLLPSRRHLVVFSFVLVPFVTIGLWYTSLVVSPFAIFLYVMLIGAGMALWLGLFLVDKAMHARLHISSRLHSYAKAGLVVFILSLIVELPIHWVLQRLSDRDGDLIRASIESYRVYNGAYPDDLSDSAFDVLPQRSWTGSSYTYSRDLWPYKVQYASIGGRERFYSHQYKSWSYPFDE
jgi:hypothetical protein